MLTSEIIKQNAALKDLTADQITAIETLSKNDEGEVIGKRVREIYSQIDTDVKEVTGIDKPDGVKTYAHVKALLTKFKSSASNEDTTALKATISDLEAKIKKGGGVDVQALQQQLRDSKDELNTVKSKLDSTVTDFETKLKESNSSRTRLELNHIFDSHIVKNGIQFKKTIPDTVLQEALEVRKASLLQSITPDEIDDGKGGKIRVFRDGNGEILRNSANKLEPFTGGELFASKIADLIDTGKQQTGAGTGKPAGAVGGSIDLSSAKSKSDALRIASEYVMESKGLARTDMAFDKEVQAAIKDTNYSELPA